MSNAAALVRLGYVACMASLMACAQGIESPGTEGLTNNLSGGSSSVGGASAGGNTVTAGSASSQAGSFSAAGSFSSAGSSAGSSATGGTGGTANGAGGTSGASAGSSAAGASAGGSGPTTGACGHFQPGNMGPTLESMVETGTDSIYFDVRIDNPDQRDVLLSDLKFRYYVDTSVLGTLMADFYLKNITAVNKTTRDIDGNPTATVSPDYIEYSFPGSSSIIQTGEFLSLKIHTHNSNYQMPDQTSDYSYNPSTALIPWCKIVLYEGSSVAWGTTPP